MIETWVVFRRALRLSLRTPTWAAVGLVQPLFYLALFGPMLANVAENPDFPKGGSWQVYVPGLLVQLAVFGAAFVGFRVIAEARSGVLERMRVTPAPRAALLVGRVMRDMVVFVVQAIILMAIATVFGLRAPLEGMLLATALIALLSGAFSAASYAAGMTLGREDALAPLVNLVTMPLLLLSGILLPMTLAPGWLDTLSRLNPVRHVVDGVRALFLGQIGTASVVWAGVVTFALAAAGIALAMRSLMRDSP